MLFYAVLTLSLLCLCRANTCAVLCCIQLCAAGSCIVLSGNDDLCHAEEVKKMCEVPGHIKVCDMCEVLGHIKGVI